LSLLKHRDENAARHYVRNEAMVAGQKSDRIHPAKKRYNEVFGNQIQIPVTNILEFLDLPLTL